MARKRVILELGMGNDLHGGGLHQGCPQGRPEMPSTTPPSQMIRSLGIDAKSQMFVEVTIGVPGRPEKVDTEASKRPRCRMAS